MSVKTLATLVAALTVLINLLFAYTGISANISCTIARVFGTTVLASDTSQ